jgi:hypothetical protein
MSWVFTLSLLVAGLGQCKGPVVKKDAAKGPVIKKTSPAGEGDAKADSSSTPEPGEAPPDAGTPNKQE